MELKLDPIDNSPESPAPMAGGMPPQQIQSAQPIPPTPPTVPVSPVAAAMPEAMAPPAVPNPSQIHADGVTPTGQGAMPATGSPAPLPTLPVPPAASGQQGVMVGGGFAPDPGAPVSFSDTPAAGVAPGGAAPRRFSPKLLIGGLAALVVIGGGLAYYFGYYMNPSVIYSQSLSNTGKGYDKLINYVDAQSQLKNQSYTGSGNISYDSSSFSADGKMTVRGDDNNGELTLDIGADGSRYTADVRAIKSSGTAPDLYVKATGLQGLGALFGLPEDDSAISSIDGAWIFIDHTLLQTQLSSALGASSTKSPTRADILDEAKAFGKVNQQYLFSSNKDKAVMKVVKQYGSETVSGHKTYHYQVAVQKDNVKKYIGAQADALKASKLGAWLKQNHYDETVASTFDELKSEADSIKSTETADVWMDTGHRMIYKVRFSADKNAAKNYAEVGLDYKGGDSFPFFFGGANDNDGLTENFLLVGTLNTKTNAADLKFNLKDDFDGDTSTFKLNFSLQPSSKPVKVEKPSGAKPLNDVLQAFGVDPLGSGTATPGISGGSTQSRAQDSKRRADVGVIQTQVEAFFSENGYYPSLTDLNSPSWLKTNMKSLDVTALVDPSAPAGSKLVSVPAAHAYAYQVTNEKGLSCEADDTACVIYTLTATMSDGTTYKKENLD